MSVYRLAVIPEMLEAIFLFVGKACILFILALPFLTAGAFALGLCYVTVLAIIGVIHALAGRRRAPMP